MPYANNSAFARQMREYLKGKRGRIDPETWDMYQRVLLQHGEAFGWKDSKTITVREMEVREADLMGRSSESTASVKMTILLSFLNYMGNKEARRFKKLCTIQPASDSVFMTEAEVASCRLIARGMSDMHELIFSLLTDNGLRPSDISRLTVENGRKLVQTGEAMILGKGRNGGKLGKMIISPITIPLLKRYMLGRTRMIGSETFTELILVEWPRKGVAPIDRKLIYKMMAPVFERAGLDASPRDGRKTCGNRVYRLDRDVAMAAMILRHGSPDVTFKHYIGADSVDMRDVQARIARNDPAALSQMVNGSL